ncbi:MAG TPA: hypothetical protein DCS29_03835 [Candidatus Magasanikbacteria bacterium]|nr:hypothetical protein [Candidatus Magasanikbacteria bacterium]
MSEFIESTIYKLEEEKYAILCVDLIILDTEGNVLLGRRTLEPAKGRWVLPGGYVQITDDNIESAAVRSAKTEFGVDIELTHLVDVMGDPDMKPVADPRFYAVQVLYTAVIKKNSSPIASSYFMSEGMWVKPRKALWKKLGFNHKMLIKSYLKKKSEEQLIPIKRTLYTQHFGQVHDYLKNNYMHTVVMGIVINERNEILLAHRVQEPFKGAWDLPGGHMYAHESVEECLKREVREELGVDCEVGDLFHVYSDKGMSPKFSRAMVLYFIRIKSQEFVKNVEMDDFGYFPLDQIPDNLAYHIDGALKDVKDFIAQR